MEALLGKKYFMNNTTFNYIDEITYQNQLIERRNRLKELVKMNTKFKKILLNFKKCFQDLNFLLFLSFFISLFSNVFTSEKISIKELNYLRKISYNSVIIMTIKGSGEQYILSKNAFNLLPNKIQINDGNEITDITNSVQTLPLEINKIKMIWDDPLIYAQNMFMEMENLIDIDLSNFNFSSVINMGYFFHGCTSLQSVNMSNANSENVINMQNLFAYCSSLRSVNLTNFKTSSANLMKNMFLGCSKLEYLDLSSFES